MMVPDLNLLRVFDVLLEERNVTRAGARLGLTQSAVSHALSRLRYALNDELFVRGPSGMLPTPRALEIGPQVHAALNQLQAAITLTDFDPRTSERRFTIAAGAYACGVLVPPLVSRLAAEAPLSELAIIERAPDVVERLDTRRLDFVVGGAASAPERLTCETILTETLVWVVGIDHPLAEANEVTLEMLAATPHAKIAAAPIELRSDHDERRDLVSKEDAGAFEAALAARGLPRCVGVQVPDTYAALAVATRSNMAALIPRRLALIAAQGGRIRLIEPPYPSPAVEVTLLYVKDRLNEPAIAWMRDQIRTVAASL
jgi:DNA-binding transcriptional LysR family regulator